MKARSLLTWAQRAYFEQASRQAFNKDQGTNARKAKVPLRGKQHEFDLYQPGVVAGGISTSPWRNKTGTSNTGGQDRVAAELLWLHLCTSVKRKGVILRDEEMAKGTTQRFGGEGFFNPEIEVWLYDETANIIAHYANL